MGSKLDITSQKPLSYDDFEPFCNWRREQGRDTLVLHLPEFKKEQLKVQISHLRILKISGERPLTATKSSRFYKEVKVEKEYNADEIHAKFTNGLLHVVMPKTICTAPQVAAPLAHEKAQLADNQQNEGTISESDHGASKKHTYDEEPAKQESSNYVPRNSSNMKTKIALATALASAIGVYIFHRYKIHVGEVDDTFTFNFF